MSSIFLDEVELDEYADLDVLNIVLKEYFMCFLALTLYFLQEDVPRLEELQVLQIHTVLWSIILDEGASKVLLGPEIFFLSEDEKRMEQLNEESMLDLEEWDFKEVNSFAESELESFSIFLWGLSLQTLEDE